MAAILSVEENGNGGCVGESIRSAAWLASDGVAWRRNGVMQ